MIDVRLRPKAVADLENIADYTFERWGNDQEVRYLRLLEQSFQSLALKPYLGRRMDEVFPDVRRLVAGQHIVLYFVQDDHVDIVRVLHHSMDIEQHFEEEL